MEIRKPPLPPLYYKNMEAVMSKSKVVARMTIERGVGVKTIVDVDENATFSEFYRFYSQEGRRYSTKKQTRVANRNEGIQPWGREQPGLEVLAVRFEGMAHVKSVKVRIIRKRAYRRLISAAPDQLGSLPKVGMANLMPGNHHPVGAFVPSKQTPVKSRYSILAGRRVPA